MNETKPEVLIIDDDADFMRLAKYTLEKYGYRCASAANEAQAMEAIAESLPDIVLLDQMLGDVEGTSLIQPLRQQLVDAPIILITANSTVEMAVRATKLGAFDFLPKPLDDGRLVATLLKALDHGKLAKRVRFLEEGRGDQTRSRFDDMIGASPQMQTVYHIIENVAPTDASVMIVGESGTGKELVARAIHRRSRRAKASFVPVNMGAVPRDLVESTLFGHERGAFTGAERVRIGMCQEAAGGTLFLDEVREMPLELQPKLLRFLQERTIRRIGGTGDIEADARIVSATNVDPVQDVRDSRLREDLYYRLNVVPIFLPPLRERRGDIALLATYAMRLAAKRNGKDFETIDEAAMEVLTAGTWPGNVRQLFHALERVVVLNRGTVLTLDMLPADLQSSPVANAATLADPGPPLAAIDPEPELASEMPPSEESIMPLETLERRAILDAIKICGSAAQAARRLEISEATIYRRVRKYDVELPEDS